MSTLPLPSPSPTFDIGAEIAKETEIALRKDKWDEGMGTLSGPEAALIDPHTVAVGNQYERALVECQAAREAVMDALQHGDAYREPENTIDRYVTASRILYLAAQQVCDCENLPDDGEAQGIQFSVPLVGKD